MNDAREWIGPPSRRNRLMPHSCGRTLLTLLLFSICNAPIWHAAAAAEQDLSEQEQHLLDAVIAAHERNYAEIKTISATYRYVVEDRSVDAPETQTVWLDDNTVHVSSRYPRSEHVAQYQQSGDWLRIEMVGVEHDPGSTVVFRDGIWKRFYPRSRSASIHRTDQLGRESHKDLREQAADFIRQRFVEMLRTDPFVEARREPDACGTDTIYLVRNQQGHINEFAFSADVSFLPTQIKSFGEDGSLHGIRTFSYQEVLDGQAFFLQKSVREFRQGEEGHINTDPAEGGPWRQRATLTIEELVVNGPIDESVFELDLSGVSQVSDNTPAPPLP